MPLITPQKKRLWEELLQIKHVVIGIWIIFATLTQLDNVKRDTIPSYALTQLSTSTNSLLILVSVILELEDISTHSFPKPTSNLAKLIDT